MQVVHGVEVYGMDVDTRSGCEHYRSPLDIVALAFPCCNRFYACPECHDAVADHEATVWERAHFETRAILCGACGQRMSIRAYLAEGDACSSCGAAFNPGCRLHHHLYFALV